MSGPIVQDNLAAVLAAIQDLVGREVLVGIPSSNATRSEDEPGAPINNAQLGYIHEHGAPASNIPARPFLVPGVQAVEERVGDCMQAAARAALRGNQEVVDGQLNRAGLIAQSAARYQLNSGQHEALAQATIVARRRKGRTGTQPLVDTGQLRNSITYVIREKD